MNDEFAQRSEIQNVEFQKLNSKLQMTATINTRMNDELNEKTEQICQLYSANTKLNADIGKLETEIRHMLDNEKQVIEQINTDREIADKTKVAYGKCEATLQTVTDEHNKVLSKFNVLNEEVSLSIRHLN